MVKPEWGTKRSCQKCKALFYDLRRDPIICPKCDTEYQPELLKKRRRGRNTSEEDTVKGVNIKETDVSLDEEIGFSDVPEDLDELGFDQDDGLLEDASDLVDGDEDMGDVLEHAPDKDLE